MPIGGAPGPWQQLVADPKSPAEPDVTDLDDVDLDHEIGTEDNSVSALVAPPLDESVDASPANAKEKMSKALKEFSLSKLKSPKKVKVPRQKMKLPRAAPISLSVSINWKLVQKCSTVVVAIVLMFVAYKVLKSPAMIAAFVVLVIATIVALKPNLVVMVLPRRHEVVGDAPVKGLRGTFWKLGGAWFYSRFGWSWIVSPSWRERNKQADEELYVLRRVMKIVAFANSKGGSAKTALAVWLIAVFASSLKAVAMTIFDVNESPGSTAKRLGLDRDKTIKLRDYVAKYAEGEFQELESHLDEVEWHRQTGVMCIASDKRLNAMIDPAEFKSALANIKMSSHTVFTDLGNAIMGPTNLSSVQMAHTVVFPGNVNMADSLDDLGETMGSYYEEAGPEKVKNGVIVIVGHWVRTNKQIMRKRVMYAERYTQVVRTVAIEQGREEDFGFRFPIERVFVVPRNRYMRRGKIVNVNKIPIRVKVLLKEIMIAILKAKVIPEEVEYLRYTKAKNGGVQLSLELEDLSDAVSQSQ
jgi:cellulose biosynthesis protein BcsQ